MCKCGSAPYLICSCWIDCCYVAEDQVSLCLDFNLRFDGWSGRSLHIFFVKTIWCGMIKKH